MTPLALPPLKLPVAPLLLGTTLSLALLVTRIVVLDRFTFSFLAWNLFLAALPLAFALLLRSLLGRGAPVVVVASFFALWLLFLPNAPYLVSDLVHLRPRRGVPHWLDITMLASFAVTGLLFGAASLAAVTHVVVARSVVVGRVFVVVVAALAGFGVHLGRFARWNSWDIVAHPRAVLDDAVTNLGDLRALGFSAVFAVLLLAMTIQLLNRESLVKTAS